MKMKRESLRRARREEISELSKLIPEFGQAFQPDLAWVEIRFRVGSSSKGTRSYSALGMVSEYRARAIFLALSMKLEKLRKKKDK